MRKQLNKIIITSGIILLLSLFSYAAETNDIIVINNVSSLLLKTEFTMFDDLDDISDTNSWNNVLNVSEISNMSQIVSLPFYPLDGNGCMAIQSSESDASAWRYFRKTFAQSVNLSQYNCFFYAVNCPDFGENYITSITFQSDNDVYTATANIKAEGWNGIFVDITSFKSREAVRSITIGVKCGYESQLNSNYLFYIDSLMLSKNVNAADSVRCLTSRYYINGGTFSSYNDYMRLNITNVNPFIETYSLDNQIFYDTNSIKVKFKNNSDCTAITFYYTTILNPTFNTVHSNITAVESGDQPQTCYFPLPEIDTLNQLRFVFNGATNGDIEIYSITPASTYVPKFTGYGTIDKCIIASNKRELNITGTLTDDAIALFNNSKLYLYELTANQTEDLIIANQISPIAETKVDTDFRFKLELVSNNINRICNKYAVAVNINNNMFLIDYAKYISNPEMISVSNSVIDKNNSCGNIKGMQNNITEAQSLGVKNTTITVQINKMISQDNTGYAYDFEGTSYYFSCNYVNILDKLIKTYSDAGINISLILVVGNDTDNTNSIFVHPDSIIGNPVKYYAFNISAQLNIQYLRAICGFLAVRYTSPSGEFGLISNFIVGYEIGLSCINYNMGNKSLDSFVSDYATAFRVIYNTVRSVCSSVQVYISLNCGWDENLPADMGIHYDNRAIIDTFSARIKSEGDIYWNVAFNPYPSNYTNYISWQDNKTRDDFDSNRITTKNIDILCKYLRRKPLLYNGNSRSIILLEQSQVNIPVSEYVYTYYKISSDEYSEIKAFIISRQTSFSEVFKYIDTINTLAVTEFVKDELKITDWTEIFPEFNIDKIIKRNVCEISIYDKFTDHIAGEYVLWSFKSAANSQGWVSGENCNKISSGNDLMGSYGVLKADLSPALLTEYRGISNKFNYAIDFTKAPIIKFNIQIAMLPDNVSSAKIMLSAYSGDNYIEASGVINESDWNTVIFDLRSFEEVGSIDRMKIWVKSIDNNQNIGKPVIVLSDISVISEYYSSVYIQNDFEDQKNKYLELTKNNIDMTVVWGLIGIIIITGTVGAIYLLGRSKE